MTSHEAQSLHLRYGPPLALPTLSPCRYLHEPKARFPVGRLIPLAEAGIAPAGSARLGLTHRSSPQGRRQRLPGGLDAAAHPPRSPPVGHSARGGTRTALVAGRRRRSAVGPASLLSCRPDHARSRCPVA